MVLHQRAKNANSSEKDNVHIHAHAHVNDAPHRNGNGYGNGSLKNCQEEEQDTSKVKESGSGSPLALSICASGICGCYLYFGKIQEQMFSKGQGSDTHAHNVTAAEAGSITTFMLALSCFTNVFVAKMWILFSQAISSKTASESESDSESDSARAGINTSSRTCRPLNHVLLLASEFNA